MNKLTLVAASIVFAAVTAVPAFAQVSVGTTTPAITAGHVKVMPLKAKPSIHATLKKVTKKRRPLKRLKARRVIKRTSARAIPSANATSTIR